MNSSEVLWLMRIFFSGSAICTIRIPASVFDDLMIPGLSIEVPAITIDVIDVFLMENYDQFDYYKKLVYI